MTTRTNPIRKPSPPTAWGRLLRPLRTGDRGLLVYRLVRRVLRAGVRGRGAPFVLSGLYSANVSALRSTIRRRRGYEVRAAVERDLPQLSAYFGSDRPIEARYRRGDLALMALHGNEIGAAVWLAAGPTQYDEDTRELGCSLGIPPGMVYTYDGKGTRLGAWGTLMAHLPNVLDDLGISRITTLIDYENTLSIRSHESLGYRRLGYVGCLKLARWVQPFYTNDDNTWRMLPGRIEHVSLRRAWPSPKNARLRKSRRAWERFRLFGSPSAEVFTASRRHSLDT